MLTYRIADPDDEAEIRAARDRIFGAELGYVPDDGLDAKAAHVIARAADNTLVAAFRFLGPELRPFDFEEVYPLDELVAAGRRPAMLGRLWVHPEYRGVRQSMQIHRSLLAEALYLAMETAVTDYFLCTFTRLLSFYRAAMFRETGAIHVHLGWGPLHVLHRDMRG